MYIRNNVLLFHSYAMMIATTVATIKTSSLCRHFDVKMNMCTHSFQLCGLYCWHASYPLALDELVAPLDDDDGQTCSKGNSSYY